MNDLNRILNRLGRIPQANQVERMVDRGCTNWIVSGLMLLFVGCCGLVYAGVAFAVYKSGLGARLPQSAESILGVVTVGGFFVAIVLASGLGYAIRRLILRILSRR